MQKVNDIRLEFKKKLENNEVIMDKTGVSVIEISPVLFLADEPVIFGKVNEDYIKRELDWYLKQSLNIWDMYGDPPAIWKAVASKSGDINSNYGWCIFNSANGDQFQHVIDELKKSPNSRRATMIYTRPSMHIDYDRDGMSDFICTNAVQYWLRDGKVHAHVQMRSNDAIFGYKNDYAWQSYVLDKVTEELDRERGDIYWSVSNIHIYDRHFGLIT